MKKVQGLWRHEDKYLVHELELEMLHARLRGLLRSDEHTPDKGFYHISSLYFDDWKNSMLWQNIDGLNHRTKYRVRRYEDGSLFLEEKSKQNGLTLKESAPISENVVQQLIVGGLLSFQEANTPMMRRFALKERSNHLRPVVIVDYDRTAFVCSTCNVRITFDRNISGSAYVEQFLDRAPAIPVFETDRHVLEVKYDALLPDYIEKALYTGKMQSTASSKYTFARNAMLMPRRKEICHEFHFGA